MYPLLTTPYLRSFTNMALQIFVTLKPQTQYHNTESAWFWELITAMQTTSVDY